jgi:hypothetical protein
MSKNEEFYYFVFIKIISIKVDVNAGSIIEVLGNVDNRNQIIGDTIVTFEPEQTANFGKK